MRPNEEITAILAKGANVGADDLFALRLALVSVPLEEVTEVEESAFEALALIVSDPAYDGELALADLERA